MADLFNARQPEEIVFGQNMTSLTMAMSRAIGRTWEEGDEIIVTNLDHDANITPWTLVASERGVKVRWLDFAPENCVLRIEELANLVNDRTKLVAVTLASNAVGTLVDIARVCEIAHRVDALVYVDAVHYAPHGVIDVQALDCDFLVASAYKFFGPHIGIMYGKYDLLNSLDAYKVRPAPDEPPIGHVCADYSPTTQDANQTRRQRLVTAMQAIRHYEESLGRYFLTQSLKVPGLRVFGITDIESLSERAPTFAVNIEGHKPRNVSEFLGDQGIFVWDGHYYAVAVMDRLGLLEQGGLVRIGFAHYNTVEEVDRLIVALEKLASD